MAGFMKYLGEVDLNPGCLSYVIRSRAVVSYSHDLNTMPSEVDKLSCLDRGYF